MSADRPHRSGSSQSGSAPIIFDHVAGVVVQVGVDPVGITKWRELVAAQVRP